MKSNQLDMIFAVIAVVCFVCSLCSVVSMLFASSSSGGGEEKPSKTDKVMGPGKTSTNLLMALGGA